MYVIKKKINMKEYYYLVKDIRIKKKKKKFQVYIGKQNKLSLENKKIAEQKIEQKIIDYFTDINKKIKRKNADNNVINKDIFKNILLKKITKVLKKKLKRNLVSLILFGSYAKGTEKEESDIDLVLVCEKLPEINKRHDIIKNIQNEFLIRYKKKLSFIMITKKELSEWIINENPLLYGLITGYEYLYDKDYFFRKKIVIFKNRMRVLNVVYTENYKNYNLGEII